jgi:hypothetical protein
MRLPDLQEYGESAVEIKPSLSSLSSVLISYSKPYHVVAAKRICWKLRACDNAEEIAMITAGHQFAKFLNKR